MLTAKEIEEFTMTQEEIEAACEKAVDVAVMQRVHPVDRAYDIGDRGIIPLLRVFPGI